VAYVVERGGLSSDSAALRIYVDGAVVMNTPMMTVGSLSNTGDLRFGYGVVPWAPTEFTGILGTIDEVEIFDRALTAEEIEAIWEAESYGKCKPEEVACAPAPGDLVAWWPLDETSGSTAEDIVGGNNGSYVNGPVPAPGMVNTSLEFNGEGQSVEAPEAMPHDPLDVTVDAWIYPNSLGDCWPSGSCSAIVEYGPVDGCLIHHLGLSSDGELVSWPCHDSLCENHYTIGAAIPIGQWTHVAFTADSATDEFKFYVNGELADAFNDLYYAESFNLYGYPRAWTIGDAEWGGLEFDGRIDELEIFERALSGQEIRAIYEAGSSGKCKGEPPCDPDPSSQGYWHRQCLGVPASEGGIDPGRNGRGPSEPTEPMFVEDLMPYAEGRLEDLGFYATTTCEGMDAYPPSDMCEKALKQLTALILNVGSGRLMDGCEVDLTALGCESDSVGGMIDEIATLIHEDDCNQANSCAAALNEGEGLVDGDGRGGLPGKNGAQETDLSRTEIPEARAFDRRAPGRSSDVNGRDR
jgi:hypothetical protein